MDRKQMVERQIIRRGVKQKIVLDALLKVPREELVPDDQKHLSYLDGPLPIGQGQTISQPYIVAFMTEALQLKGGEVVLEIGTGSGYQTAILAEICQYVFSLEIIPELGEKARKKLQVMGYDNVSVIIGDGTFGLSKEGPYDAILVTAAPHKIPERLIDQLKPGGKLVIPVGEYYQELVRITKDRNDPSKIIKELLLDVRFVPMTGDILEDR